MRVKLLVGVACAAAVCLHTAFASAQSIIRRPGQHPKYALELEPHALLTPFSPPGDTDGWGYGLGARGTIVLAEDGFISTINDSVGLGFGFDWLRYHDSSVGAGPCGEWTRGPGGQPICRRINGVGGDASYYYLPVVMQWNFWLHRQWSVFGEPGLGLYFQHRDVDGSLDAGLTPVFHAGGRWHFSDWATLTMRVGYPAWSVGVSFFL
jgi:hypothetical protein